MAWIKEPTRTSEDIFNEIISKRPKWNGNIKDSSSAYEYWVDYLRDMYDLTMKQADEICRMLKTHYKIEHFYYGE